MWFEQDTHLIRLVVGYSVGGWLLSHHEGGKNSNLRGNMLDYLISLFDYANDFSWDVAKASHAVVLCRMEQGEVKDYSQTEKIDRIRRVNAQRHNVHRELDELALCHIGPRQIGPLKSWPWTNRPQKNSALDKSDPS